eukprot:TRINITY_DN5101_c0_g1_i1.p1 TRINITY_DN5101_c0_g1~~TRINITY_DN5101_c0_g1_i1.p1  ORF type:complete len:1147 (-),score=330.31 TRINITY_DN5101_c0_g1_i1:861-4301(-)
MSSLPRKSGWIYKQGADKNKSSWKHRWLVTEGTGLAYYKREDMKNGRQGFMELKFATEVHFVEHKKRNYVFNIVTPDRTYEISCDNDKEREEWVYTIKQIMTQVGVAFQAINLSSEGGVSTPTSAHSPLPAITPSPTGSGGKVKGLRIGRQTFTPSITKSSEWDDLRKQIEDEDSKMQTPGRRRGGTSKNNALVSVLSNTKKVLERKGEKTKAYMSGVSIGRLYASVTEAKFDTEIPSDVRPLVSAYFERQLIDSTYSKNHSNPHWKESFMFDVVSLESRLKLKLYDRVKSDSSLMNEVKIPIKHLEDEKQHRQWYDLSGKYPGKISITWRLELNKKASDETDIFQELGEVIGTAQISLIGARGLKDRPSGAARNAFVHVKYGKQEFKTEPVNIAEPEWNFGIILRVRNTSETVFLRVLDMEKVGRTHLGTVTIAGEMLMNSEKFDEPTERWIKLKLEPEDDPHDNQVGGELHIKYRYRSAGSAGVQAKKEQEEEIEKILNANKSDEVSISEMDVPEGFPEPPQNPGPFNGSGNEEYKAYMKKKLLRETWEGELRVYIKKQSENDEVGMQACIERYRDVANETTTTSTSDSSSLRSSDNRVPTNFKVNFDDVPDGFPPAPPVLGEFNGNIQQDKEGYKEYMKRKMLRESWENTLTLYRKKEAEGDAEGMHAAVESMHKEMKTAIPEPRGVRQGGSIRLGGRSVTQKFQPLTDEMIEKERQNELQEQKGTNYVETTPTKGRSGSLNVKPVSSRPNSRPGSFRTATTSPSSSSNSRSNSVGTTSEAENPFDDSNPFGADQPAHEQQQHNTPPQQQHTPPTQPKHNTPNNRLSVEITSNNNNNNKDTPSRKESNNTSAPQTPSSNQNTPTTRSIRAASRGPPPAPDTNAASAGGGAGGRSRRTARASMIFNEDEMLEYAFSLENCIRDPDRQHDSLYKIIIIGDSGVGKTNLLGRWMDDRFLTTSATINVEFATKSFEVGGKVIKVQLWDTAGQEQYRSVTRSYYRKAHGCILVYDITDNHTFTKLEDWLKDVKEAPGNENTQVLLVGNKSDLEEKREVDTDRGIEFSRKNGINFLETSALSGDNVSRAFQIVLTDIYKLSEKYAKLGSNDSQINGKATVVLTGNGGQEQQGCCSSFDLPNSITSFFNK